MKFFKAVKAAKLVDILHFRGALDYDERNASIEILFNYYFRGIKSEEKLVKKMEREHSLLSHSLILDDDYFKGDRRVITRLLVPEFRKRLFDFCLDYIVPFAEKIKFSDLSKYRRKA